MAHDELSIDIKTEHNGAALIFRLQGALDLATAPSVRAALLAAVEEGKREIIVELSRVAFLDSTGLGALVGAHRSAMENGGRVRLVVNAGPIARLLDITGLIRVLNVYPTLDEALEDRNRLAQTI